MELLFGLHPVEEAVRARSVLLQEVLVARERRDARLEELLQLCRQGGVRVVMEGRAQLTRLAGTDAHQGVVARMRERPVLALEDLLRRPPLGDFRLLLALDGVEDPHNLGALLRSCNGAGADGVILPERRSAPLSATVAKSSAGAIEHVQVARVTNLVRSLEQCKEHGCWIVGLDERGEGDYTDFDWKTDCVLVLGREGAGMHELAKRTCDHLLRIPMAGAVRSLNVSVAGAVVLFEAMRQRRTPAAAAAPKPAGKVRKGLGS